jgi:hypothetical protein
LQTSSSEGGTWVGPVLKQPLLKRLGCG